MLQEKHLDDIREIRDLRILTGEQEAKFSSELDATKRQVALYKRCFEESAETIRTLEESVYTQKSSHAAQMAALRDKIKSNAELAESELNATKSNSETLIVTLRQKITELEESVKQLESGSGSSGTRRTSIVEPSDDDAMGMTESDFQELGATTMYSMVVETKKALITESKRAADLQYYLDLVHKEIESKAPLIESQRRDYKRVLDSHDRLTKRLDAAVNENTALKRSRDIDMQRTAEAESRAASIEQQNKDLSDQLQHLLYTDFQKTHGSGIIPSPISNDRSMVSVDDVISEHLLTFDDIAGLQTKNMQLVAVVRKLSADQENAVAKLNAMQSGSGSEGANSIALQNAHKELNTLRDSRQRMEEMVSALVQQRDVLRVMLEESDRGGGGGSSSEVLAIMGAPSGSSESAGGVTTPLGTPSRAPTMSPVTRQLETRLSEVLSLFIYAQVYMIVTAYE